MPQKDKKGWAALKLIAQKARDKIAAVDQAVEYV